MKEQGDVRYENVIVSTRIRLARNFADYPFPNRLKDEASAREIIRLVAAELNTVDAFTLYHMNALSPEIAESLKERYLISRDLIEHRRISAALVSFDETISVMINEEDHIREQYFMKGFELRKVYERISGIDDIIAEAIPFAFDETLGYLTACPTNLGTGLRASVMLFLPALARSEQLERMIVQLKRLGLVVRGCFGEGSAAEGDLYQVSNEVTLGPSEAEILSVVEQAVNVIAVEEFKARARLAEEGGVALKDRILRAYGTLTNCLSLAESEFMRLAADVKLGIAFGMFDGSMEALDDLIVTLRPANINRMNGFPLGKEEQDLYRAEYAGKALRGMELLTETKRKQLFPRG